MAAVSRERSVFPGKLFAKRVTGNDRMKTMVTIPLTIEELVVRDNSRLLVINDNNQPGSACSAFHKLTIKTNASRRGIEL
jgi:hypothetical protein